MEKNSMNIVEKIEQRRLKVEEALKQERETIDQALENLKTHLSKQISKEVTLLKTDLEQQEKEQNQKKEDGTLISTIEKSEGIFQKMKEKIGG